jgi:hypothetical protein
MMKNSKILKKVIEVGGCKAVILPKLADNIFTSGYIWLTIEDGKIILTPYRGE